MQNRKKTLYYIFVRVDFVISLLYLAIVTLGVIVVTGVVAVVVIVVAPVAPNLVWVKVSKAIFRRKVFDFSFNSGFAANSSART